MSNILFKGEPVIRGSDIASLIELSGKYPGPARICYHESEQSELHLMMIRLKPGDFYPPHRHLDGDETLILMEGELSVTFYEESLKPEETLILSSLSSNHSDEVAILVSKNHWHSVQSGENGAIFIEVKKGPFDRAMNEIKTANSPEEK